MITNAFLHFGCALLCAAVGRLGFLRGPPSFVYGVFAFGMSLKEARATLEVELIYQALTMQQGKSEPWCIRSGLQRFDFL